MASMQKVAGAIDTFIDRTGAVFAWASFALVLVMATNVLLRYMYSLGSVWAQELEWHLLVPISLLGMSYALRHGEHVRVDIFFSGYSERTKLIIEIATSLASIALCVMVIYFSYFYVLQSWNNNEGSANPGGIDYRYVLKAFIPFGFALLGLQSFADLLKFWIRFKTLESRA
jgi:TRAP-type mannitol/chloroaromatic compound transport system permease small subunit